MLDKLLETLRAWGSLEKGRTYSLLMVSTGTGGTHVKAILTRSTGDREQTDQNIPLSAEAGQDWPEAVRERVLRLIVELQQEAEA